jgi:hypothetical protein
MIRPDFFISYVSGDVAWAEWVGWVIEEERANVVMQAWDFVPGSNFVLEMQRAAATAERTIALLSPDYLKSKFAAPEWAAAFAQDPEGMKRSLVPVRVRECALEGLLRAIVHIDLVGLHEADARKRLLDGLSAKRAKPDRRPAFPGAEIGAKPLRTRKPFPGEALTPSAAGGRAGSTPYRPKIAGAISDLDRTRFIKHTFETVQAHFQKGLAELQQHPAIDVEFRPVSETKFRAEVFVNGTRRARCKIWLGGILHADQISYYEGDSGDRDNAFNEALTPSRDQHELALSALTKMSFGTDWALQNLNLDRLTENEAAEYLWRRFVSALE